MQNDVNVLVVDDDPVVLACLSCMLRNLGYGVLQATHGQEALEVLMQNKGKVHILLSDVMMPTMDGFTLRNKVLECWPRVQTILMSGSAPCALPDANLECVLLWKPFGISALSCILSEASSGGRAP